MLSLLLLLVFSSSNAAQTNCACMGADSGCGDETSSCFVGSDFQAAGREFCVPGACSSPRVCACSGAVFGSDNERFCAPFFYWGNVPICTPEAETNVVALARSSSTLNTRLDLGDSSSRSRLSRPTPSPTRQTRSDRKNRPTPSPTRTSRRNDDDVDESGRTRRRNGPTPAPTRQSRKDRKNTDSEEEIIRAILDEERRRSKRRPTPEPTFRTATGAILSNVGTTRSKALKSEEDIIEYVLEEEEKKRRTRTGQYYDNSRTKNYIDNSRTGAYLDSKKDDDHVHFAKTKDILANSKTADYLNYRGNTDVRAPLTKEYLANSKTADYLNYRDERGVRAPLTKDYLANSNTADYLNFRADSDVRAPLTRQYVDNSRTRSVLDNRNDRKTNGEPLLPNTSNYLSERLPTTTAYLDSLRKRNVEPLDEFALARKVKELESDFDLTEEEDEEIEEILERSRRRRRNKTNPPTPAPSQPPTDSRRDARKTRRNGDEEEISAEEAGEAIGKLLKRRQDLESEVNTLAEQEKVLKRVVEIESETIRNGRRENRQN